MILTFPQAFFTSAQDASEGSTERPASARTADEVRAGSLEADHRLDGDVGAPARTTRDLTDIFFDSIKATVEAFDGR